MTTDLQHRASYGDLWHAAVQQLWGGADQLARHPFPDPCDARAAVHAWHAVLAACQRHLTVFVGGQQRLAVIDGLDAVRASDAAALRLHEVLEPHRTATDSGLASGAQGSAGPVASHWQAARRLIGASTDLLLTHQHRRVPGLHLDLDDVDVRDAGLHSTARLLAAALEAAGPLHGRAADVGLDPEMLEAAASSLATLREATAVLATVSAAAPQARQLADAVVARPAVRVGDPRRELADRVERLHRAAHELADHSSPGVASLRELARTALLLHQTTDRVLQRLAAQRPALADELAARRRELLPAQQAWADAVLALRGLHTSSVGHVGVRIDADRVRHLLDDLTTAPVAVQGATLPTLLIAARCQPAVAREIAGSLDRLTEAGTLYVAAATLTGNQVSNDPHLARAKLRRQISTCPRHVVDDVRASLRLAATDDSHPKRAAPVVSASLTRLPRSADN